MASDIIGETDFNEVYINASFEECSIRDVKGLYKKALNGEIKNFTGLDAPFEAPENPALCIDTETQTLNESVDLLFNYVIKKIKI